MKDLKDLVEELETVLITDSSFSDAYESTVQAAYIKNLKFITELESFFNISKVHRFRKTSFKEPNKCFKPRTQKEKFQGESQHY